NEQLALANEQKAVANEQKAETQAAVAGEKAQEANQQRDEAQKQRDEVAELNKKLARTLYIANMNLAGHAWEAGTAERTLELLDTHRPLPGEADLRGFEWYYLHRLCHSDLLTLPHAGPVLCVTYSPDAKR